MASHIEHEMNSCLSEMERLQAKMMELQKQKEMEDAKQEKKTNQVEPNMAVMENWLDKYKSIVLARNEEQIYNDILDGKIKVNDEEILRISDNIRRRKKKKISKGTNEDIELLFHIQKHKAHDTPSQFMIDFIEATHNLFQIQQKRIDELENVVAKLNAKNE